MARSRSPAPSTDANGESESGGLFNIFGTVIVGYSGILYDDGTTMLGSSMPGTADNQAIIDDYGLVYIGSSSNDFVNGTLDLYGTLNVEMPLEIVLPSVAPGPQPLTSRAARCMSSARSPWKWAVPLTTATTPSLNRTPFWILTAPWRCSRTPTFRPVGSRCSPPDS